MENNICRFVPRQTNTEPISILHYVLETCPERLSARRMTAFFSLHLALSGEATFSIGSQTYGLREGDLFFFLPATPFTLSCGENFRYIYISFLGTRASQIMDQLKITPACCVFPGMGYLKPLWESGLGISQEMIALRSESILMFTFSEIGRSLVAQEQRQHPGQEALLQIRKYVDENFSDPDLSLTGVSRAFSYNPKYISSAFKSAFRINFTEYVNLIRIQHACTLMEQSFTCVKDIAAMCGFRDPMYFSRVFKAQTGQSPREHCLALARSEKP